jgi:hypothetical protein
MFDVDDGGRFLDSLRSLGMTVRLRSLAMTALRAVLCASALLCASA